MTAQDRKLEARAAALTVEHLSGRTYRVSSGSGGAPHIVRGAIGEPLGQWQCDCMGHAGRKLVDASGERYAPVCSHIRAVAQHLMIADRPERPAPTKLINLLLAGGPAATGVAAGPAGEVNDTDGGTMPQDAAGLAVFEVYAPTAGAVWAQCKDGEISLRLKVPGSYRAAVLALVDAMQAGGQDRTVQLVPVLTNESKGA